MKTKQQQQQQQFLQALFIPQRFRFKAAAYCQVQNQSPCF
jgi:hypothetical protein